MKYELVYSSKVRSVYVVYTLCLRI